MNITKNLIGLVAALVFSAMSYMYCLHPAVTAAGYAAIIFFTFRLIGEAFK